MKQEVYLHYAHCTRFTEGKLDRAPWSEYELREVVATLEILNYEQNMPVEWRITYQGEVLACEDEKELAFAVSEHELMASSRYAAGYGGRFLKAMNGDNQREITNE